MKILGMKPRINLFGGVWGCFIYPPMDYEDIHWEYWNKDCLGEGDTPLEAYNNWLERNEKLIERYTNENS